MRSGGNGADPGRPDGKRWWPWLAAWTGVGLGIRVASVLGRPHQVLSGDAWYYHWAANLLVEGKGFINPLTYYAQHHVTQGADFPPGFIFVLAAAALVGFKGVLAQRIWVCIVGSAGVALTGIAGREIAGRRVGLIAALIVAVYPNIWISDQLAMSEALSPILVALVLLAAYRFYRRPDLRSAVWLGLSIGLAALTRDELSLLGLFVLVPLTLADRRRSWSKRFGNLGAGTAAAVLVVAPWVGYNLSRFQDPVFISSGLGVTLASTNCAATYSGHLAGYWDLPCAAAPPLARPGADESVQGSVDQHFAIDYMKAHAGRLPVVLAARFGRAFGLYRPIEQLQLDAQLESRPFHWAEVGLYSYYVLSAVAAIGVFELRRRRVPLLPLLAVGATVVVSVLMTFGDTRYRTTWEISLAIMAAVAIDRIWAAARPGQPPTVGRPQVDPVPVAGGGGRGVLADSGVLIVIPAFNEAGSVGQVVAEVQDSTPKVHILVVDDASRDATAARARAAGADVVVNPINLGVGGAMRVGFRYARANGYRAVVQVDGDGQHDSRYLESILAELEDDHVPRVVIGARFAGVGDYPVAPARRAAMWVLSTYLSRSTGVRLTDVTSGFRASNRAAIELFARAYPTAYLADTVESLALVARRDGRVAQVPVAMRNRISGSPSQSSLKAALHLVRVATRLPFGGSPDRPVVDLEDRVRRLAEDLALVTNEVEGLRPPEEHRE